MSKLDHSVRHRLLELREKAVPLLDATTQIEEEIARLIGDDEYCSYAAGFIRNPSMTPEDLWANRGSFDAVP